MLTGSFRFARISARNLAYASQRRSLTLSSLQQKSFPALVQEIKATNKDIHYLSPKDLHGIVYISSIQNTRLPPHVIDVRERHEVEATGTIPGAIVLPRGILERDVSKFIKQDDPRDVVVYCAGGFRSVLAAESLVRLGYGLREPEAENVQGSRAVENKDKSKVWSLDEGMDGWIKGGFEVEKKNK